MRNTYRYEQFKKSLSKEDQKQYREMSINQQKDWYIGWLESNGADALYEEAEHQRRRSAKLLDRISRMKAKLEGEERIDFDKKISIVTAVHGREHLWDLFTIGVMNLKDEFEYLYEVEVVVACSTEKERLYFYRRGFTALLTGNEWLGKKWNDAIQHAYLSGSDYILMIGSDDVISPDIVDLYAPYIDNQVPAFWTQSMLTLNWDTDEIKHFKGYKRYQNLGIGAGKMISKEALENSKGRPSEEEIERGLDSSIEARIRQDGFESKVIRKPKPYILDIKGEDNLNKFEALKGDPKPADYDELEWIFKLRIK